MTMAWTNKLDVLRAYLENGYSSSQIAAKLKTTPDAVEKAVKRYNLSKYRKEKEVEQQIINLEDLDDKNFDELKKAAKLQWPIPQTKIPENPKNKFKTYLVVGDLHIPKHNEQALKSVFYLMDDVKFDGLINLGDHMDLGCISHWNKTKHKSLEGQRLKSDYIIGNSILDEFDKRLPKGAEKHFFMGNHEVWANDMIEDVPALDGLFDPESALKLKERGYKVYPYNQIVRFGRLCITHGIYACANPAKAHALKLLSNVLCGHLHSPEMCLIHSPAKEVSVVGYINGCLCDMSPDYMKGKPSNWSHGIAILYVFPDGQFDVNLIRIIKNKFVFNGKVYDGGQK